MGNKRKREKQQDLWIATTDVVETPPNVFYDRLNHILDEQNFDAKVERLCRKFYKKSAYGRPSLAPGVYFRCLLIGYFEGLDSERGIAWRIADSLSLRRFLGYALDETTPDHSTISRTRRLFWLETHKAVFGWVLRILTKEGLVSGRTVSIDATTLEANAALKSIVRRDNGQSYNDYLRSWQRPRGWKIRPGNCWRDRVLFHLVSSSIPVESPRAFVDATAGRFVGIPAGRDHLREVSGFLRRNTIRLPK